MELRKTRGFLLRLSPSIREEAESLAKEEGISLNHFISLALAERIVRMEGMQAAQRDRRSQSGVREGNRPTALHTSVSVPVSGKTFTHPLRPTADQRRF